MDSIKSVETKMDIKEEMGGDKEIGHDQGWKIDEDIPDILESKFENFGNFICVDCGCTFASEEHLSAHIQSTHCDHLPKENRPMSPFKKLSNAKRKLTCQNVASDCMNSNESEDSSDSLDESSDEFSCEDSDSSSELEEKEIDKRVWLEELPEAPSPPTDRFPFSALPHNGTVPREGSPLDYFNLFFTDELIQRIVDETNRYASQKLDTSFDKTNSNEMRVFLSLTILQGIFMQPNSSLCWSKKPLMKVPFFRQCMTRKRFSLLKRYLQFSNYQPYNVDAHSKHSLHKLKIFYVFDYLRNKFSSLYTLPRDVTIDVSLMQWKERLGWDQFMPLKKAQSAIKLYMLCDSNNGYVWDAVIYAGKGTSANGAYRDLPVSSRIAMSLMNPLLGKGYCLTTDEWFTSPQLADLLIEHQIDTYGTIKQTRNGVPSQLKKKKLKQKGELIAFRRGKVVLMKWKEKTEVTLLSTVHSSEIIQQGSFHQPDIYRLPQTVKGYNYTMGGIDCANTSLSSNPIMRKHDKKFYKKIFFNLVDVVVWNSFILYGKGQSKKPLDFQMELIDLLAPTIPKLKGPISDSRLRLSGRHFPSYVPNTATSNRPERICPVCSRKRDEKGKKIRRRTRYECRHCDVGLCVDPCFEVYHTKVEL